MNRDPRIGRAAFGAMPPYDLWPPPPDKAHSATALLLSIPLSVFFSLKESYAAIFPPPLARALSSFLGIEIALFDLMHGFFLLSQ